MQESIRQWQAQARSELEDLIRELSALTARKTAAAAAKSTDAAPPGGSTSGATAALPPIPDSVQGAVSGGASMVGETARSAPNLEGRMENIRAATAAVPSTAAEAASLLPMASAPPLLDDRLPKSFGGHSKPGDPSLR